MSSGQTGLVQVIAPDNLMKPVTENCCSNSGMADANDCLSCDNLKTSRDKNCSIVVFISGLRGPYSVLKAAMAASNFVSLSAVEGGQCKKKSGVWRSRRKKNKTGSSRE